MDIQQIAANDVSRLRALLQLFAEAFDDAESYLSQQPDDAYLQRLLAGDSFVALVALDGDRVVGGLAAYELQKFEQARSEFYIYDLAVAASHRRRSVATGLIAALQEIAAARGAWVIFVQADTDEDDEPAIALYNKLGQQEEVLHFDIPVPRP